jgi:hypothetical protein
LMRGGESTVTVRGGMGEREAVYATGGGGKGWEVKVVELSHSSDHLKGLRKPLYQWWESCVATVHPRLEGIAWSVGLSYPRNSQ